MHRTRATTYLAALVLAAGLIASHPAPLLGQREQPLAAIIAAEWEFEMRDSPETASIYGDYRFNDTLDDRSIAHVLQTRKTAADFLVQLKAIDTIGLSETDQLNRALLLDRLATQVESIDLKNYEMPIDQFNGDHLWFPRIANFVPLDTTRHVDDYLSRLHQIPRAIEQIIAMSRQGRKDGLMPPKYLLEKVVTQCDEIETPAGEASAFAVPLKTLPAGMPSADRERLHDAIVAAVDREVRPAYRKLARFVKEEYAPRGRLDLGLWALPRGDAIYRAAVRARTTTAMTPEQIHELGLAQLKELEGQMNALAAQQGFADWKAYRDAIDHDPKSLATSREQILDAYRGYLARMEDRLPQLFGVLPKAKVVVTAVEPYREKQAAAASYSSGTPDGARPGRIMVNTGDFEHRTLPAAEAIAYHEGIPGHHLQRSIQQEVWGLPAFRQHSSYTAYTEGWGLYAERLAKELGMYQIPANEFHRLASDQFRAARLVLDTGIHFKRWTRDQVVAFFRDHSIETDADIQSETDRYVAMPAQALAYKIGQLKFLELRQRAQDRLGAAFDIRAFHDHVLGGGPLPLDVLDTTTDAWIKSH